jgi:hypothetical protein
MAFGVRRFIAAFYCVYTLHGQERYVLSGDKKRRISDRMKFNGRGKMNSLVPRKAAMNRRTPKMRKGERTLHRAPIETWQKQRQAGGATIGWRKIDV